MGKPKVYKVVTPDGYHYQDKQGNVFTKEQIEGYPIKQIDIFKGQIIDAVKKATSLYELNAVLDKQHRRGVDLYMNNPRRAWCLRDIFRR